MSEGTFLCPICKEKDRLQKVSIVVDNGWTETVWEKPDATFADHVMGTDYDFSLSISDLAFDLGIPPAPNKPSSGLFKSLFSSKDQRDAEQRDYENAHANWEEAHKKWKRLYYCHRCDIVYDPQTGKHCERNRHEFIEFCYS